jgi:hypothetical protein
LVVIGYQYSTGDVVTDTTLPIEGVESSISFLQASYQRTLDLFGRTSNFQFHLPYANGTTDGLVEGEYRRRDLSGMGDLRLVLSVNLLGAPSMDPIAFRELTQRIRLSVRVSRSRHRPGPTRPTSSSMRVRTGGRPSWDSGPSGPYVPDCSGATREQDNVYSAELHLVRHSPSGFWMALDLNYYGGGRTTVDGVERDDRQRNSRIGATLLYPLKPGHAIRTSVSTGIVTDNGGDFDTITLSYVYLWR